MADPGVHDADPGVHDAPIRGFTIDRDSRPWAARCGIPRSVALMYLQFGHAQGRRLPDAGAQEDPRGHQACGAARGEDASEWGRGIIETELRRDLAGLQLRDQIQAAKPGSLTEDEAMGLVTEAKRATRAP
jgi:hypothetical protein